MLSQSRLSRILNSCPILSNVLLQLKTMCNFFARRGLSVIPSQSFQISQRLDAVELALVRLDFLLSGV